MEVHPTEQERPQHEVLKVVVRVRQDEADDHVGDGYEVADEAEHVDRLFPIVVMG